MHQPPPRSDTGHGQGQDREQHPERAQDRTHGSRAEVPDGGPLQADLADLVTANHILFHQGIVDAFGHVSARHPTRRDRWLMARNVAPGQVQASDIVEYAVDSGEAVAADAPRLYLERYIHSEIYKARPDVMAVVHNHSPAVLPFGIVKGARLRPVCHMSGFLAHVGARAAEGAGAGAGTGAQTDPNAAAADASPPQDSPADGPPVFEIRDSAGPASDLLIRTRELGADLARCLAGHAVVLMRGHGCTVVAGSLRLAVYRAIYTEVNARLLLQALPMGDVTALTVAEAACARDTVEGQVDRPWNLWKQQAAAGT